MISTAATKIAFPYPENGGLRDPDPHRRSQRLLAAGLRVERQGAWDYVVRDGERVEHRRTLASAERIAHRVADRRLSHRPPARTASGPTVRPSGLGPALVALALGGFTLGTSEFLAMGLLPQIAGGVRISVPTAGHVIAAYALGVFVGAPVIAGLGARFPRKQMLIGLMAAYAAGNLLSALAPTYPLLMLARFLAGLPHGAYFGVACLVAADLAEPERRARAVARVLLGLSVANVIGVPAATWLGQGLGWRVAFVAVAALAVATALSIVRTVPVTAPDGEATLRRELRALRSGQVWLTLAIGAIGGGGLFAVYTYISPILTERAGLASTLVPIALGVWGLGMVAGSILAGYLVDWRPLPSTFGMFVAMAAFFALFALTSANAVAAVGTVFLLGMGLALPTALQVRLIDVAGDSQTLAAALNHSSFNAANALGAWLGGAAIAAGWGLTAPMWVAVVLSLAGLGLLTLSTRLRVNPS
jgi:MFS transporter, DHA1 family, inner membrane transport protein